MIFSLKFWIYIKRELIPRTVSNSWNKGFRFLYRSLYSSSQNGTTDRQVYEIFILNHTWKYCNGFKPLKKKKKNSSLLDHLHMELPHWKAALLPVIGGLPFSPMSCKLPRLLVFYLKQMYHLSENILLNFFLSLSAFLFLFSFSFFSSKYYLVFPQKLCPLQTMIIITVSVYLLYSCSFTVEVSPQEESYFFWC